jgi:ABC-type arginine transport system permease subunit
MYDLAVICAVGFAAWQGSQAGMLAAAVAGLEMIVSLTVGVLFHELVAGLLADGLKFVAEAFLPSEFPYQGLAVALAFALLTWGTSGWLDELTFAAGLTLLIALAGFALGAVFGALAAAAKLSRSRLARGAA